MEAKLKYLKNLIKRGDLMNEKLISNLIGAFDYKGIKVIEEGSPLKTNEVRYEFIKDNILQLKYQDCPHDKIVESIEGFKLFAPEIDLKCNYGSNDTGHYLWIEF